MDYRNRGRGVSAGLAGIGISLLAATAALADVKAPPDLTSRQELNPGARTQAAVHHRTTDLFSAPAPEACSLPADPALKFTLTSVEASGAKRLSPEDLAGAYADFKGREITPADLCAIRDRVAARLFRRGILARVLIPQQQITGGVVKLKVIEAEIVTVRYQGDIGPAQAKVEALLNHLRGLSPFDLDTAQRYLLLANDIPGVHASATLLHSTRTEGCSNGDDACAGALDMVVILGHDRFDAVAEVQNLNADTLGPWSGIARVDFNSLTALGESTSLIAYTTLGNTAQQVVQVIESARLGANGVYVQGSFAYGHSAPVGSLKPLNLDGQSFVGTVEIDDPVIRLKRLSLTLGAGMDIVSQETTYPGGTALSDDNLKVIWARARSRGEHDFAQPVLGFEVTTTGDLNVEVRQGLHVLGASQSGALALSRPQGQSNAFVARADGDVALRLDPLSGGAPITFSARWQGQWANNPLLAYEEQSMGNLTIGRGFDPDTATGDRAIAAEVKTEVGPFPVIPGFEVGPYGFYDVGYAVSLEAGTQAITLESAGGGVEFLLPHRIRADLAVAAPLTKALPFATTKPPTEVLLQLVAAF
jgi:hemolysin activation/secretion protein